MECVAMEGIVGEMRECWASEWSAQAMEGILP